MFTGALSWRRLTVLVMHVHDEQATRRALGDQTVDWDLSAHLLAASVDALRVANWQRAGKGSRPKPIERPGVQGKRTERHGYVGDADPVQVANFFAQFAPPPLEECDGN